MDIDWKIIFTFTKYDSIYSLQKVIVIHSFIETDRNEIYTNLL